jgi:hypothetical protein
MHILWLIFFMSGALAHQSSLTSSGKELYWPNPNVPLVIRTNTSDMSSSAARTIIQNSMAQWNVSSIAKISTASSSNNEIKFVSNFPYGSAVVGVTELSFSTSGAIQKASIVLNDDYFFHETPGIYSPGQIYLGDFVTHEMGHLMGLSHSEVLNASMFYSSFSGQDSVSLDDKTGIRQKYDTGFGLIEGYVKGGNSIGVLGAHVQAISVKTGESSGAFSDEKGFFRLGGLELNDTYYLYVSPVKKSDSLPGYFANVQENFCPGSYVGSFFSKCGSENQGRPQAIKLTTTETYVDVGTVTINCSLKTNTAYNTKKINADASPLEIYQFNENIEEKAEQAFVGWFRNPSTSSWSSSDVFKVNYSPLNSTQYFMKVSVISFALGTQLEYEVDVLNSARTIIDRKKSFEPIPGTGAFGTDFHAFVQFENDSPDRNNFTIRVRSRKLGNSSLAETFPDYTSFTSGSYLPYLLVTSIWDNSSGFLRPVVITEANLSDNEACLDAPFTYAVKKAVEVNNATSSDSDQSVAGSSCGTIEPPHNGPGSSLPLLVAGFLLAMIASNIIKSRKNFLS